MWPGESDDEWWLTLLRREVALCLQEEGCRPVWQQEAGSRIESVQGNRAEEARYGDIQCQCGGFVKVSVIVDEIVGSGTKTKRRSQRSAVVLVSLVRGMCTGSGQMTGRSCEMVVR